MARTFGALRQTANQIQTPTSWTKIRQVELGSSNFCFISCPNLPRIIIVYRTVVSPEVACRALRTAVDAVSRTFDEPYDLQCGWRALLAKVGKRAYVVGGARTTYVMSALPTPDWADDQIMNSSGTIAWLEVRSGVT